MRKTLLPSKRSWSSAKATAARASTKANTLAIVQIWFELKPVFKPVTLVANTQSGVWDKTTTQKLVVPRASLPTHTDPSIWVVDPLKLFKSQITRPL
jgi:hypothetical protein